jgi:RNA polymerase sigma factor (sigma-70 family)
MNTLATHATIFLRLKADDTATRELAWSDFRKRYAPIIAGFARKLSVKTQDIDDIIQDVMIGFFSQAPTFIYNPLAGRFRGYLKVCTFRAMQRRLGKSARFQQIPLDEVDPDDLQVEQAWRDVWEEQRVLWALDATRRQYNNSRTFKAFELHVIKGLSVKEVAEALGIDASTVHRAKSACSAAMKLRLDDLIDTEG